MQISRNVGNQNMTHFFTKKIMSSLFCQKIWLPLLCKKNMTTLSCQKIYDPHIFWSKNVWTQLFCRINWWPPLFCLWEKLWPHFFRQKIIDFLMKKEGHTFFEKSEGHRGVIIFPQKMGWHNCFWPNKSGSYIFLA